MREKENRFPGKTVWILLVFMTILMGFPFLFYYRFSTVSSDILMYDRLKTEDFGRNLSYYFENIPFDSVTVSEELKALPLIDNLRVEIYDGEGTLISKRISPHPESETVNTGLYKAIKRILDPLRKISGTKTEDKDSEEIREKLLRKALGGQEAVDYIFTSGEIGDRILYFSYPVQDYSKEHPRVKGVLFMEYRDASAKAVIQKQRNQFAVMFLIFTVLLTGYVLYILIMLILPLRRLLRKSSAVIERTGYLLSDKEDSGKKNEIGEITRRLDRVAEMLGKGEREIGQYMSELKHIIRNPLSVIRVSLEGLMMDKSSERDLAFSNIIQKNLSRIDNYISSYSGMPENSGSDIIAEEIDIAAFLNEIIRNYTPLAERHCINFKLKISGSRIIWKGFYSRLFYVIEQVINNAVDFSPENGIIEIEASQNKKRIYIAVKDRGPGIPSGREKEIFRQYVSYREKSRDSHTGTGLFLSMNVLQNIGGDISAENDEAGGAVFTISLPLR